MAKDDNPLSAASWMGRFQATREVRKALFKTWQENVAARVGKGERRTPTGESVNVPADWARTKNKQAQLWYQVPEVQLEGRQEMYAALAATFASALNFELTEKMHTEHVMNECLGDVINASGIMIAKVGYEGQFENVPMPLADPTMQPPPQPGMGMPQPDMGTEPPPTTMVPRAVYQCIYAERISPAHFLWPVEFIGSNWQKAHWLGWDGYKRVAEAVRLGWVPAGFEGTSIDDAEWLLIKEPGDTKSQDGWVKFAEAFYRPAFFDPNEKDVRKIKRVVIVEGLEGEKSKVVDEDFKWQQYDPQSFSWKGMTSFPIKVATIAHISDKAIPPSDSEMGRSQVRELNTTRAQFLQQRKHSMPLRWVDVNQVDEEIVERLRKGTWQDMIPMNGPGDHAIGEVARASFPHETWEGDRVIKADLDESWSMGQPQMSAPTKGDTTATEIRTMQTSLNVRLSFEQGWVLRFFIEIAQATASLMQLFYDQTEYVKVVGPDGIAKLQPFIGTATPGEYFFKTKPDSQLKLDAQQERSESLNLYKLLRQDPLINPTALVGAVLEKHGIDPTKVFAPPQPPKKEGPKVAYSFKGEDLLNPIAVALIQKGDTPLTPEDIAAAKALIGDVTDGLVGTPPTGAAGGAPPAAGGPPPTGATPPHPGPAAKVPDLGRRYEHENDAGGEGTRDSGLPSK